jgi:hypothetical protein
MSKTVWLALLGIASVACGNATQSQTTGPLTLSDRPDVPGTIFTIVFENENASTVLTAPFFSSLAQKYGVATTYTSSTHPSLPNYILLTSGSTHGLTTDNDPPSNLPVTGHEHLAYQMDQAGVMWRAYMESMGAPCTMTSSGDYSAHHDPFLYYADIAQDPASCNQHVVDFDQNFAADLASGVYRYMWITPNMCDDMHNCPLETADAWLQKTVTQIQASDAYKKGGAIFVLFDEGSSRAPGATAPLATLVVSEQLAAQHTIDTPFDHRSYVATVEDILGLPRLPATVAATPMNAFFVPLAAGSGVPATATRVAASAPLQLR